MAAQGGQMVRCTTCGTVFSTADASQLQAHEGHSLEHIQQG
jgi:hypothetical protein